MRDEYEVSPLECDRYGDKEDPNTPPSLSVAYRMLDKEKRPDVNLFDELIGEVDKAIREVAMEYQSRVQEG